ncbi:MAG: hypothetical protein IJ776_08335 [Paludibacteraceae bacterium]|nr:hypothetical protein [Paludibacteraceae bacterium]
MKKAYKILAVIALLSSSCFAQYEQSAMYKCYLSQNKQLWRQYVTTADWKQMNNQERQRLLNYEYGYIAYGISIKDKDIKQMLQRFNEHIELMEGKMPESTRLTYLSAAASYYISISKITILSNGPKTFSYSEKAVKTDPDDPYALTLRGSIYFYCPSAFGGDKKLALDYLQKAEDRFRQTGDTIDNWNYRSVQMVIAQCYEKTGNKEKAIEKCRQILRDEPEFSYIRDCYLPELLGIKPHDDNNPQNMGASFVSSFGN